MTSTHPYQMLPIDERVKRVLATTPLIDGHNDLPQQPRACFHGKIHDNEKFDLEKGFERGMTDIPRLKQGAVGGQFWSVCVPCLRSAENFTTPEYSDMARDAIEQIDLTLRLVESYPETFQLVSGPSEVKNVYASGKIACSIGIEGLSDLGRAAVKEMNRLGMIVDLSHVSEDCANQVLDLSRAPVMFSHSNAKGVFDCPRNVPDHILDKVPANGGIVMVTFVPEHVTTRRRDAKMEMVIDHLFYVANRIGWDHVGLGSDFDGIASVIPGLEDVKCYPHLLKAILDRGATEDQLAKVIGENILKVWAGVEYDGYYQMEDPDPEDKLGLDWYGKPPPDEGLYIKE
ncbi:microsomal dipeptidase [Fusarium bulbicola]|nr:microsomal dipeptidase [Fusarium bulbicola]